MTPDEPTQNLGRAARSGARASVLAQVGVQLGSAAATVILARILTPAEFGIIALAQSLLGAAALVSLAGITAAIVTHVGDIRVKAATYFWTALVLGVVLAGVLSVVAGPLVALLGQPRTGQYVVLLSATIPLSLMTLVPQAVLQRRLQFGRMNLVTILGALGYFVTEVALVLFGWGAWGVIVGQVVGAAVSLVLGLLLAQWFPFCRPDLRVIRDDIGLVANMGLSVFFGYLGKNADYWVVSRFLGGGLLGVYYIAYVLPSIIRVRLSGIFRQVMLPIVARFSDEVAQTSAWAKATRSTYALAFPLMFGIAGVAGPLVAVFFGSQWGEAAGPMRLITLAGVTDLAIGSVSTVAIARRKFVPRSVLIIGLRALLIAVGTVVASLTFGSLIAVALAVLIASVITLLVQEFTLARPLGIGFRCLGNQPLRLLAASGMMFGGVHLALALTPQQWPAVADLALGVAIGVVLYCGVAWVIAREALADSMRQLVRMGRGQ